jgi:dienelactone hydrolase
MPTRPHAIRLVLVVGAAICASAGVAVLAPPYWAAARVLSGSMQGAEAGAPSWLVRPSYPVREEEEALDGLRSKRYSPVGARTASHALLVPGAHPAGIDEPRIGRLARALAGEGWTVHTAELPSLSALRLGPDTVQQLGRVAVAASERAGGQRVAAFGISVTGGFLLQAALEPRAARALSCVVAIGAHHDLRAVARAYAQRAATGRRGGLDPYGARVLVAAFADALVPPQDVDTTREVIDLHVTERYAAARAALLRLSPPARELIGPLLQKPRTVVPSLMAALIERRGDALAALSPAGKLGALRVPAFLLHGEGDPVVPSTETRAIAAELARAQHVPRVLITPMLRHAEGTDAPTLRDAWPLVAFMADVLDSGRDGDFD